MNIPWDKPLPMELVTEWKQVLQSLTEISSLKISRFGGNVKGDNQLIFCDASTKAYATVLYLRLENGQTNPLFSKMRLVPKKRKQSKHLTIPRLELLGVLIGIILELLISL